MIVRRGTGVRERGSARTFEFYTIAATLNNTSAGGENIGRDRASSVDKTRPITSHQHFFLSAESDVM
jgi:hypothetical protein